METPPPPAVPVVPAPSESSVRNWSMAAHLSALAGFVIPFGNLIGPFIIWQIKKDEMPAVAVHAREALNFQLSCLIYLCVSWFLIFVLIGVPLMILVGVLSLVCIVIASIKAANGEAWRYPVTIRLLK